MRKLTVLIIAVVLISTLCSLALAQEKPTITSPLQGAALGPNYDVVGSMPAKAFVIVITDVVNTQTGEVLRSVPGIRHWTNQDGTFRFRVASPRVSIGDRDSQLQYRVRVFEGSQSGYGPEAVVNCTMAQ